jgi:hypothetical protein
MSVAASGGRRGRVLLVVLPLVVLLLPLGYDATRTLVAGRTDGSGSFLEKPEENYPAGAARGPGPCDGRDREFMRFHHMDFLKELRDEILREGIRGDPRYKLERCRDCHTSRERFCNRCHEAVNLTPDCFKCHDYP